MPGHEFSAEQSSQIHQIVSAYLERSDTPDWSCEEYERSIRLIMHDGHSFEFAKKKAFERAMKGRVFEKKTVSSEVERLKALIQAAKDRQKKLYEESKNSQS